MKEELYRQALSLFNSGDYEKALDILKQDDSQILSAKEKQLIYQCEKQITEQYYYLIHEYIQQEDYLNAHALKVEYKVKFGSNPRIEDIVVPEKKVVPRVQIVEPEEEEEEQKRWPWIIAGVVILLVAFLYLYNNKEMDSNSDQWAQESPKSESEIYQEKSEEIISQLTKKYGDKIDVINEYPELSKYCAFSLTENETEYLLIYDLEQDVLRRFENYNLQTINAGEVCLPYYSLSMNESNDKILIQGNNGANSIGYTEYVLELNPQYWRIREICSGHEITKQENGYKVTRIIMTRWVTCNADSEYANIHIYYDRNGNLIPSSGKGEQFSLAGIIGNKYAITMSLSFNTNGNIYGTYYYNKRGRDNTLYLYGGASANEDMVLLEFTESGQQTGIFKGRLTSRALEGTFTNNAGMEMPFELRPVVESTGSLNSSQSSNSTTSTNTYMPDRDAEFPGGMLGLGQYITDNLQYPASAKEKGISGNVRVSYIIDKDGSIIDAKVIDSVDPDLDNEALRLIRSMPKWKPGVRKSRYVKMRTSTVINFELK